MSYLRYFFVALTTAIFIISCQPSRSPDTSSVSMPEQPAAVEQMSDVEYMSALGLMKGHLIVGKELLDLGKPEQAEPHMGHPVEEIYGEIEDELTRRNVPEFKSTMNQLQDLVKTAPQSPQVVDKYQAGMQAIDVAIAAVPEEQRQSPKFVLEVITKLLEPADEEYKAAIIGDRIVEEIEYQDSRGFVFYAESLYQSIAPEMEQKNSQVHQTIVSTMKKLKKAWPSPISPEKSVMTPEQVSQMVNQIKTSSQKI